MFVFVSAVFFLLITPGPGVLSIAGVGASFGKAPALRYLVGLFLGTNLVALAVVTGVAGLVLANPLIKPILLYASMAYLTYLALRVALAGTNIEFIQQQSAPGIKYGIIFQIINPKAYVVNTTLFTGLPIYSDGGLAEIALKFLIINAIWIPIHILWTGFGISFKQMNLSPKVQRVVSVLMGLSLLVVVGLAVRQLN